MMLVMYWRVRRTHPASGTVSLSYMVGFTVGIAMFLGSLLLPDDVRWIVWLLAIAAEIAYFARPQNLRATMEWGPDDHHLVERFGIFTIIVLGEAFVKVLDDAQGTSLGFDQMLMGIVIVILLFSLWWLHFSDSADHVYDTHSTAKLLSWSYGHLFLAASLVMFGVASKKVFAQSIDDAAKYLKEETRLLLTAALVIFFIAQMLINAGHDRAKTSSNYRHRILAFAGAAAMVAIVGVTVTGLSSLLFTGLLAVLALVMVARSVAEARSLPTHGEYR